jgi:uncharacterized protein YabN with tetrapyrrole methylase and pyrophosphatase domain
MSIATPPGSLACVGLGMLLGAHLTPRARSHIEQADVVFVAASDALVELWVQQMRPDARSLQPFYADGKPRADTYREMTAALLDAVRAGQRVCAAFYGHPGVFATVPHAAIGLARMEGFDAVMEPGVSAEDCLYADLGIDPGRVGCQHFEATQLLFYRRVIDPAGYLVLWQLAHAGDASLTAGVTSAAHRQLLVDRLLERYPPDHQVTLYEAPTLAIQRPRIEHLPLRDLGTATVQLHTTLVVPPAHRPIPDPAMRARAARMDATHRQGRGRLAVVPTC